MGRIMYSKTKKHLFLNFEGVSLEPFGPKGVYENITTGLITPYEKTYDTFMKQTFHFLSEYIFIFFIFG